MIKFSRAGKQVRADISYLCGGVNNTLFMYWECGSEVTAESLSRQLTTFHERSVEREIKTAYEAGYKAGKQHKHKRTWFHCFITHINESLPDWKKE